MHKIVFFLFGWPVGKPYRECEAAVVRDVTHDQRAKVVDCRPGPSSCE